MKIITKYCKLLKIIAKYWKHENNRKITGKYAYCDIFAKTLEDGISNGGNYVTSLDEVVEILNNM